MAFARRDLLGAVSGFVGAYLIYRGATGKCECYRGLGIETAGITDGRGVPGELEGIGGLPLLGWTRPRQAAKGEPNRAILELC
jgi:hypothetical protein